MLIRAGEAEQAKKVAGFLQSAFAGRNFVYRPTFEANLNWLRQMGAGEYHLALESDQPVAIFFARPGPKLVTPVLLTDDQDQQGRALTAFFQQEGSRFEMVLRPIWDLRVGLKLIPLMEACGFRAGPAELLFRLLRSEYQAGYKTRELVDGSRVDYRMHSRDLDRVLGTLTPLLQGWSAFYGFEGHSSESCRLFTASVDAQKAAVIWVLLPAQCRAEQNDCYLHWKEVVGDDAIFVRSTVTEDPFRGKGIGSSLHRFMLSRFFEGPEAVAASYISTNEENKANVGMLESLGYRRQLVCRYHHFIR